VRSFRLVGLALVLLVAASAPARADGFIVPFLGFNFGGDSASTCPALTNCEEKRANFGVALGSMGTIFGFEEDISYAKNFFGETPTGENSVLTLMSNVIIGVGAGPVRPYFVGGVGLIRPHVSSLSGSITTFDADKNAFGYDIGGGITGLFSRHVGIRGDLRHFKTMQDIDLFIFSDQKLNFWRASLGLALNF
jgi:opacity protein-like surface antigen